MQTRAQAVITSPTDFLVAAAILFTNVFVLAQRFDFVSFDSNDPVSTKGSKDEDLRPVTPDDVGNLRRTTGMFGSGYLEMLARQITAELQHIRNSIKLGETRELVAKEIRFGKLTLIKEGLWDTSKVEGLPRLSLLSKGSHDPPSLVIRPWHQAANVVSIREFTNNAFNQHHGIQSTERYGIDTDPDGDGVKNELTRADVTAVTLWQASLQVPGRVIPNNPKSKRLYSRAKRCSKRLAAAPVISQAFRWNAPVGFYRTRTL